MHSFNTSPPLQNGLMQFKKEILDDVKLTIETALGMARKRGSFFSASSVLGIASNDQFGATEGRGSGRRRDQMIDIPTISEHDRSRNNNSEEDDEHASTSLSSRDAKMISSLETLERKLQDALQENEILKGLLKSNNPNNR